MDTLNSNIQEYQRQLEKGQIQKAYKGLMTFMSGLAADLQSRHADYAVSALYPGYMDMTYFAFTPPALREQKLKIAVVYVHEKNTFEAWLAGSNRKVQADTIARLSGKSLGGYTLSTVSPGVDSIIEATLAATPDFDAPETLQQTLESRVLAFIRDMEKLLGE